MAQKVFISGSRSYKNLQPDWKLRIQNEIDEGHHILVGDAEGADTAVQQFLADQGYKNVTVYSATKTPRVNIGGWAVEHVPGEGANLHTAKDIRMAQDANYGIAFWDGKSKGTWRNMVDLKSQGKKFRVFSPTGTFNLERLTQEAKAFKGQGTTKAPDPKQTVAPIKKFQGKYRFLSNFWKTPVEYKGVVYPSAEHAYQAAKTTDEAWRNRILQAEEPGQAKQLGRELKKRGLVRPGWDDMRVDVMTDIVRRKFQNPELARKLIETGTAELIEGNPWKDDFFGVRTDTNQGRNVLGRILMNVRAELTGQPVVPIPKDGAVTVTAEAIPTKTARTLSAADRADIRKRAREVGGVVSKAAAVEQRGIPGGLGQALYAATQKRQETPVHQLEGYPVYRKALAVLRRHIPLVQKYVEPFPEDTKAKIRKVATPTDDLTALAQALGRQRLLAMFDAKELRGQGRIAQKPPWYDKIMGHFFGEGTEAAQRRVPPTTETTAKPVRTRRTPEERFYDALEVATATESEGVTARKIAAGTLKAKDFIQHGIDPEMVYPDEGTPGIHIERHEQLARMRGVHDLPGSARKEFFQALVTDLFDPEDAGRFMSLQKVLDKYSDVATPGLIIGEDVAPRKREPLKVLEAVLQRRPEDITALQLRDALRTGTVTAVQDVLEARLKVAPEDTAKTVLRFLREYTKPTIADEVESALAGADLYEYEKRRPTRLGRTTPTLEQTAIRGTHGIIAKDGSEINIPLKAHERVKLDPGLQNFIDEHIKRVPRQQLEAVITAKKQPGKPQFIRLGDLFVPHWNKVAQRLGRNDLIVKAGSEEAADIGYYAYYSLYPEQLRKEKKGRKGEPFPDGPQVVEPKMLEFVEKRLQNHPYKSILREIAHMDTTHGGDYSLSAPFMEEINTAKRFLGYSEIPYTGKYAKDLGRHVRNILLRDPLDVDFTAEVRDVQKPLALTQELITGVGRAIGLEARELNQKVRALGQRDKQRLTSARRVATTVRQDIPDLQTEAPSDLRTTLTPEIETVLDRFYKTAPKHILDKGKLLEDHIVGAWNRAVLRDELPGFSRILSKSPIERLVKDYTRDKVSQIKSKRPTTGQAGRVVLGTLGKVALPVALSTEALLIHRAPDRERAIAQAIGGWTAEVPAAIAGARAGAKAGAKFGAKLGTAALPGVGTVAGGLIGGIAGHALGRVGGGLGLDALRRQEMQRRTRPVAPQTDADIFRGLAARI